MVQTVHVSNIKQPTRVGMRCGRDEPASEKDLKQV